MLRESGYELADIVRLTTYVTDVDAYRQAAPAVGARLGQAGVRQAFDAARRGAARAPGLLIEIEATAVC